MSRATTREGRKRTWRKVEIRVWKDGGFASLSAPPPNGRYLWLYLLTCPHWQTIPGVIAAGAAQLAEELEWTVEGFHERFVELVRNGMAKADFKRGLVWLPNALNLNLPENPNAIKSWASRWELVPECSLKDEILQSLAKCLEGLHQSFHEAFHEAFHEWLVEGSQNRTGNNREQRTENKVEKLLPARPPKQALPVVVAINTRAPSRKKKEKNLISPPPPAVAGGLGSNHVRDPFEGWSEAVRLVWEEMQDGRVAVGKDPASRAPEAPWDGFPLWAIENIQECRRSILPQGGCLRSPFQLGPGRRGEGQGPPDGGVYFLGHMERTKAASSEASRPQRYWSFDMSVLCEVCEKAPRLWEIWRIPVCRNCAADWRAEPIFQAVRFNRMLDQHGAQYGVDETAKWAKARQRALRFWSLNGAGVEA